MVHLSLVGIALEELLFEVHGLDPLSRTGSQESLHDTMLDRSHHLDEVVVCSLAVYDKRILLGISLKSDLFTQVRHTIHMLHPELIYSSECEATLELCELFLSS